MSTWLLTLDDVRTICGLQQGVENRKLESARDTAHQNLRKIMGVTGYNLLIAKVEADNTLATEPVWKALMDGTGTRGGSIKKYLARLTHYMALTDLHSEPTKTGFQAKSGDGYETVDSRTLGMHESRKRDAYQLEEELLLAEIQNNLSTYTWYSSTVAGEDRITKARRSGGFVFDKTPLTEPYGEERKESGHEKYLNG